MAESTTYKIAWEVAHKVDQELLATDFDPSRIVIILHDEGTQLIYHSAFARKWRDWILVFTEHHGFHVYHMSDLIGCSEYYRQPLDKQENTGFTDKCMFCGKEDKVENLVYGEDGNNTWKILCPDCDELKDTDHKDLWVDLNTRGAWNDEKKEFEPWGFVWGKPDIDHLEKAVATMVGEKMVDKWLTMPNEAFPETPMKLVNEDDYEPIYLAIWQVGSGNYFS